MSTTKEFISPVFLRCRKRNTFLGICRYIPKNTCRNYKELKAIFRQKSVEAKGKKCFPIKHGKFLNFPIPQLSKIYANLPHDLKGNVTKLLLLSPLPCLDVGDKMLCEARRKKSQNLCRAFVVYTTPKFITSFAKPIRHSLDKAVVA